ncbi:hypothetical protein PRZ48_008961 [Zasmidium cellare]|uniref:Uncharacterized protein n=1 Tax=Zasmidium cellare TaxID=395010 RepID=A0ABR0EHR1_ZASCE|nr:hypothetical protein PRZ48_008961 [Zasmidium cellare]
MSTSNPPSAPTPGPTLFTLPAELRNRIYHYAVVDPNANGETVIDHTNYAQPALLRGSRQLRYEASPVFYYENVFRFSCPDFDCTALVSFSKHYRRYWGSHRAGKFKFEIGGQRKDWGNLMRWLRLVHARVVPALNRVSTQDDMSGRSLASRAMAVVRELRDLPWARVRLILEQLRLSNSQWV